MKYLALYVHWPFCLRRCPYCDFNAHVAVNPEQPDIISSALLAEIAHYSSNRHQSITVDAPAWDEYLADKEISSIFFGGGTPSLMPPKLVADIIKNAKAIAPFSNNIEITLEANPSSIEGADQLKDFQQAGINRLSLGVQALNDKDLKFLGRLHDANQAITILELLPKIFSRWSFDLIYGRPYQLLQDWQDELNTALDFGAEHLSLYQLTLEKGTPMYQNHQHGKFTMSPDGLLADFFTTTRQIMSERNLPPYEISNFAKTGQESRHNKNYWQSGDWLAIGAGAEARISHQQKRWAIKNIRPPNHWAKNIHQPHTTALSMEDIWVEKLMMGLRLTEGIIIDNPSDDFTIRWQNLISEKLAHPPQNQNYRLTEQGLLLLNSILAYLIKP